MGKERRIQDRIETDQRILLEYGIPLETIPYKKIWEKVDEIGYSEEISNQATDLVEREKQNGRPGAFVLRRIIDNKGSDNVEFGVGLISPRGFRVSYFSQGSP